MMRQSIPYPEIELYQFTNPREITIFMPISQGMRETFFGPLIAEVEARIIAQQKEKWDRDLFENRLMGYAMRTDRYRLVVWKDISHPSAEPVFVELYDHQQDPAETVNVAVRHPKLVADLLAQVAAGWKGSLPKQADNTRVN